MSTRRAETASRAATVTDRGARASFATPCGDGVIMVRGGRLVGVDLPHSVTGATATTWGDAPRGRPLSGQDRAALGRWKREIEEYFAGDRLSWSAQEVELDTLPVGEFVRQVYAALLDVPVGETVSYGRLAQMAGHPRAARAVGTAMATNPIPVVIPCHRVIRSDGSLGRYGSDPSWKERLLAHERRYAHRKREQR